MERTSRERSEGNVSGAAASPVRLGRVLVGVDFGEQSTAAAAWTARHLAPGGEMVLVHAVYVPEPPAFLRGMYPPTDHVVDAARHGAEQQLRALSQAIATGLIWPEVRVGKPDQVIAQVAEEYSVDLVVLGRHTERPGVWVRFGSTPERVLRRSKVPVLLAVGAGAVAPRHLLVAVDGSEVTRDVLAWADYLMGRYGARATIVHVVAPQPPTEHGASAGGPFAGGEGTGGDVHPTVRDATQWLETQRSTLSQPERAATAAVIGHPAAEILAEAERCGSDLIVLGDRGAGTVERLLLGSVAEAVSRSAARAVLVVKPRTARQVA